MSNPANVSISNVLLFGRKKKDISQTSLVQETSKPKPRKLVGKSVAKYEVAEEKVKFKNAKGLLKKRWVIEKEFPLLEITSVECIGNWISLTWNNVPYQFKLKRKSECFTKLQEQIQALQLEHQKVRELNEKAAKRKADLRELIKCMLPIVDSAFDILMDLHAKRVDWRIVEADLQPLGTSFSFQPSTLPPLDIDFSKAAASVTSQVAKDTSKEVFAVLKTLHSYFLSLKPEEDMASFNPNFGHLKAALLAYYTLNDLALAKVVGDKDSQREAAYLEEVLAPLKETNVTIDISALLSAIELVAVEAERSAVVSEVRLLFREQLRQL